MRTTTRPTKIRKALRTYDRTRPNAGCTKGRHTRFWIGCRYCQANRDSRDGLGEQHIPGDAT
jgi:hypothetical protein